MNKFKALPQYIDENGEEYVPLNETPRMVYDVDEVDLKIERLREGLNDARRWGENGLKTLQPFYTANTCFERIVEITKEALKEEEK